MSHCPQMPAEWRYGGARSYRLKFSEWVCQQDRERAQRYAQDQTNSYTSAETQAQARRFVHNYFSYRSGDAVSITVEAQRAIIRYMETAYLQWEHDKASAMIDWLENRLYVCPLGGKEEAVRAPHCELGVFARRDLMRYEVLGFYGGQIYTGKQLDAPDAEHGRTCKPRARVDRKRDCDYYVWTPTTCNRPRAANLLHILGMHPGGNLLRFINTSQDDAYESSIPKKRGKHGRREANVGVFCFWYNGAPRIIYYMLAGVRTGEELLVDYWSTEADYPTSELARNSAASSEISLEEEEEEDITDAMVVEEAIMLPAEEEEAPAAPPVPPPPPQTVILYQPAPLTVAHTVLPVTSVVTNVCGHRYRPHDSHQVDDPVKRYYYDFEVTHVDGRRLFLPIETFILNHGEASKASEPTTDGTRLLLTPHTPACFHPLLLDYCERNMSITLENRHMLLEETPFPICVNSYAFYRQPTVQPPATQEDPARPALRLTFDLLMSDGKVMRKVTPEHLFHIRIDLEVVPDDSNPGASKTNYMGAIRPRYLLRRFLEKICNMATTEEETKRIRLFKQILDLYAEYILKKLRKQIAK